MSTPGSSDIADSGFDANNLSPKDSNDFDYDESELVLGGAVNNTLDENQAQTSEVDETDPSMDEYMANWLNQYNISGTSSDQGDTENQPKEPTNRPDNSSSSSGAGSDSSSTEGAMSKDMEEPPDEPPERIPVPAPESTDDISAMRNLAKTSSQAAIQSHSVRQTVKTLQWVLIIGFMAVVCSTTLVGFAPNADSWLYSLSVGALFIGIITFVRYLTLASRIRRARV